jgi:cytochrome c oxidase subunit 2
LLVWALIGFALARWRRTRAGDDPPQFRNNYPLEIAWTAIPLVFVCILFFYGYRAEADVDAVSPHPDVIVHVNAYRWGWQFRYEGGPVVAGAAHSPVIGSNDAPPPVLVLPLDETTRIDLTSSDVTHSFWVPDFFFKRDAIPGQVSSFDLQPDRLGSFDGRCAQFCGLDHAFMTFTVRVVTPAQFAAWRQEAGRS